MGVVSLAIVKLGLVAILGFYLYKKRSINEEILKFITFFIINFTIPFLIFSHIINSPRVVLEHSLWKFLLLSLSVFLVGYVLGLIFSFKAGRFKGEFISLVSLQNAGYLPMNIGFFLFTAALHEEFLIYIILYLLGFNIIFWSVGSFLIFKKKGERFKAGSLFTPPIVSTLIALSFVHSGIYKIIPKAIITPIQMIGDTSFVLSMIVLGCWLAKITLKGFWEKMSLILRLSSIKLIFMPLIFLVALIRFEVFSLLGLFTMLQAALPSAVSLPIIVDLRQGDSRFVAQGIFITHVFSVFTIPLWLGLYMKLSGFSF